MIRVGSTELCVDEKAVGVVVDRIGMGTSSEPGDMSNGDCFLHNSGVVSSLV